MIQENFIALIAQDHGADAKAMLQDDLSNRVLESLEARKRELAQGLFSGGPSQVTEEKDDKKEDGHDDEVADTQLVKKLVKKDCLTDK